MRLFKLSGAKSDLVQWNAEQVAVLFLSQVLFAHSSTQTAGSVQSAIQNTPEYRKQEKRYSRAIG